MEPNFANPSASQGAYFYSYGFDCPQFKEHITTNLILGSRKNLQGFKQHVPHQWKPKVPQPNKSKSHSKVPIIRSNSKSRLYKPDTEPSLHILSKAFGEISKDAEATTFYPFIHYGTKRTGSKTANKPSTSLSARPETSNTISPYAQQSCRPIGTKNPAQRGLKKTGSRNFKEEDKPISESRPLLKTGGEKRQKYEILPRSAEQEGMHAGFFNPRTSCIPKMAIFHTPIRVAVKPSNEASPPEQSKPRSPLRQLLANSSKSLHNRRSINENIDMIADLPCMNELQGFASPNGSIRNSSDYLLQSRERASMLGNKSHSPKSPAIKQLELQIKSPSRKSASAHRSILLNEKQEPLQNGSVHASNFVRSPSSHSPRKSSRKGSYAQGSNSPKSNKNSVISPSRKPKTSDSPRSKFQPSTVGQNNQSAGSQHAESLDYCFKNTDCVLSSTGSRVGDRDNEELTEDNCGNTTVNSFMLRGSNSKLSQLECSPAINKDLNSYERAPILSFIKAVPAQIFPGSKNKINIEQICPLKINSVSDNQIEQVVAEAVTVLRSVQNWMLIRIFEPYLTTSGQVGIWLFCEGIWKLSLVTPHTTVKMLTQAIQQRLQNTPLQLHTVLGVMSGLRSAHLRNCRNIFDQLRHNKKKNHTIKAFLKPKELVSEKSTGSNCRQQVFSVTSFETSVEGGRLLQLKNDTTSQYLWVREEKFKETFDHFMLLCDRPVSYWQHLQVTKKEGLKAVVTLSCLTGARGCLRVFRKDKSTDELQGSMTLYKETQPKVLKYIDCIRKRNQRHKPESKSNTLYFDFNAKGHFYLFLEVNCDAVLSIQSSTVSIECAFSEYITSQQLNNSEGQFVPVHGRRLVTPKSQTKSAPWLGHLKKEFIDFLMNKSPNLNIEYGLKHTK